MHVLTYFSLQTLPEFRGCQNQLAVVERAAMHGAERFFKTLMQTNFNVIGHVFNNSSMEDIKGLLADHIPRDLQSDPFYARWLADMAAICDVFCDLAGDRSISFCLSTKRGCHRYHKDNVPMRLLVTYAGQGTEWLPDSAADGLAYASGMSNEAILKDPSARQFMKPWDIAVFRGGPKGLLHRTPDVALNGPSILMRLDHEGFLRAVLREK